MLVATVNYLSFPLCHGSGCQSPIITGESGPSSRSITCGIYGGRSVSKDFGHVLQSFNLVFIHFTNTCIDSLLFYQFMFYVEYYAIMRKMEDTNSTWLTGTGLSNILSLPLTQSSVLSVRQTDASVLAFISKPLICVRFALRKSLGSFVNGSRARVSLHRTWVALECPVIAASACSNLVPVERCWYQIFLNMCVWDVARL